ncbi:MAG: hypothetical protein QOJ97_328 [Solirubrobacteraceae bacterium]|jgi:hypothetical protein|nr:hypothetical protein [Solirubrobacteraceae bacterium]
MTNLIRTSFLLSALALAACGAGEKILPKADVEQAAKEQLTATVGQTPKSIGCPGDMKAKVGETMRCTLTADDGTKLGVTITVKKVDGDKATYEVAVDGQ